MFTSFVGVTWWASRHGVSCGCLGKVASGPAGPPEVARNIALLFLSTGLAITRLVGPDAPVSLTLATVLLAALFLGVVMLVPAATDSYLKSVERSKASTAAERPAVKLHAGLPSSPLTRRQLLQSGFAATVLAAGGLLLPDSVKRVLACWTWLQPNYALVHTYTWYPMWVDYDTSLPDGLFTTIYWGDGTSSSGYASGHEFSAWNYIVSEGTYYPQAYVGGCWDTSTTYVQNSPTQTCFKRIDHCDECCWNFRYGRPCVDCCADCFSRCYWGGTPCAAGDCAGCWVEVVS